MAKTNVVATLPTEALDGVLPATATVAGIVELATDAETITGTDATRAITPANLAAAAVGYGVNASAIASGIVELATGAEVIAGSDTVRAVTPAGLAGLTGTTTRAGLLELATDGEAQTGSDTARAITPANLAAVTATATRAGVVELAIDSEARTGTDTARAMTAANVRNVLTGLKFLTFTGVAQAGAIVLTGAVVGDKVLYVCGLTTAIVGNMSTKFEATVSIINEIQQTAAENLTAKDYLAVLLAVA